MTRQEYRSSRLNGRSFLRWEFAMMSPNVDPVGGEFLQSSIAFSKGKSVSPRHNASWVEHWCAARRKEASEEGIGDGEEFALSLEFYESAEILLRQGKPKYPACISRETVLPSDP